MAKFTVKFKTFVASATGTTIPREDLSIEAERYSYNPEMEMFEFAKGQDAAVEVVAAVAKCEVSTIVREV